MSKLSPSKCISPVKLKKKQYKNISKELFSSPKSSTSLPSCHNEKEQRARAAIRKLLEDEANKNEELGEENDLLEKQIKSLVRLLVEKDEKLSNLKTSIPERHKLTDIDFTLLNKNIKLKTLFALNRIKAFICYCSIEKNQEFIKSFTKNSKKTIAFNGLNSIITNKLNSFVLKLLLIWKYNRLPNYKIFHLIEVIKKLFRKKFFSLFPKTKSKALAFSIKEIFKKQLKYSINAIKLNVLYSDINISQKKIYELNNEFTLITEHTESCKSENAIYQQKLKDLLLELDDQKKITIHLSEEITRSDKFYYELHEKINVNSLELSYYQNENKISSMKFNQENTNLQEKLKNQQEFLQTAHQKLQQLIDHSEKIAKENELIIQKNVYLQNNIKKIHENHSSIINEKTSLINLENNSNSELDSLINASKALEEELEVIKGKIKSSSSELNSLKNEYLEILQTIEENKNQIDKSQELEENIKAEICRFENDIENEYEVKELNINECNIEIQDIKEQYNKSREEIENLKYQIKEINSKSKTTVYKTSEEAILINKRYEENKKNLNVIKGNIFNLSSSNTNLQKELQEIKTNIKQKKELIKRKKEENAELQNELGYISKNIRESEKMNKNKQKSKEDLENYIKVLEQQVQKLQNGINRQKSHDLEQVINENEYLSMKVEKLEQELAYVNEEAGQRRQEVAQVMPEIENYAHILAAIEGKIAENENKIMKNEIDQEKFRTEINALRTRYISLISELR